MKKITIATGILITLLLAAVSSFSQTQSREDLLKQIEAKRAEVDALEKRYLSASEEDQAKYADFLHQPDTGLIRLVPREKFGFNNQKKGISVSGGGAFYSFVRQIHDYGQGSDIELEQGVLSTGFAGYDYGIMTNLGDMPLENVSSETGGAQVIAAHVPPTEDPKIRIEQRKWSNGETIDGTSYRSRVPLVVNSTYVLRSISYDRSDVMVAIRVVRLDSDDSAIILWKLVKKFPTPLASRTSTN
jgi:hypothetical protein